jgi:hypothetical protein
LQCCDSTLPQHCKISGKKTVVSTTALNSHAIPEEWKFFFNVEKLFMPGLGWYQKKKTKYITNLNA